MVKNRVAKIIAMSAAMLMMFGVTGCGSREALSEQEVYARNENTSKVLNIHTSGNELKERIEQLYPDYEEVNDAEGRIGDVSVHWIITPNDDNAYQLRMDQYLADAEQLEDNDRIDLFTVEADYAKKYTQSGMLMSMDEIGLTDKDMADQYEYTKEMVRGEDGKIYGSSWQATPGFFLYRRSIAKAVFGTDDPVEVQKHFETMDKMDESAAMLKEKGYPMFAAYNDTFYPYNAIKDTPWVNDDLTIEIDDTMYEWVEKTKTYSDNGYNEKMSEMSDIVTEMGKDGKVFGAFAAPWYMGYVQVSCLDNPEEPWEKGNGSFGDWAACNGPMGYFWGGTWLCVPKGCDNLKEVKGIIYALTCDNATMKKLVEENGEFVNNSAVMNEVAESDYQCGFLGGQNHIGLLIDSVESIDVSNVTVYDQGISDSFKNSMLEYFEGKSELSDAIETFYNKAIVLYPELKKPE